MRRLALLPLLLLLACSTPQPDRYQAAQEANAHLTPRVLGQIDEDEDPDPASVALLHLDEQIYLGDLLELVARAVGEDVLVVGVLEDLPHQTLMRLDPPGPHAPPGELRAFYRRVLDASGLQEVPGSQGQTLLVYPRRVQAHWAGLGLHTAIRLAAAYAGLEPWIDPAVADEPMSGDGTGAWPDLLQAELNAQGPLQVGLEEESGLLWVYPVPRPEDGQAVFAPDPDGADATELLSGRLVREGAQLLLHTCDGRDVPCTFPPDAEPDVSNRPRAALQVEYGQGQGQGTRVLAWVIQAPAD